MDGNETLGQPILTTQENDRIMRTKLGRRRSVGEVISTDSLAVLSGINHA